MAYSNYGAYVWKKGINITKTTCDVNYKYNNKKNKYVLNDSTLGGIGSHVVIPLSDTLLIEIYKTSYVKFYEKGKLVKSVNIETICERAVYKYNEKDIEIIGCPLDLNETIYKLDLDYKGISYLIVIGGAFGNGWDSRYVSKFILKHVEYEETNRFHYIRAFKTFNFDFFDVSLIIDKMIRKDECKDIIYYIKRDFKDLLKCLIKFNMEGVSYNLKEIIRRILILKYTM